MELTAQWKIIPRKGLVISEEGEKEYDTGAQIMQEIVDSLQGRNLSDIYRNKSSIGGSTSMEGILYSSWGSLYTESFLAVILIPKRTFTHLFVFTWAECAILITRVLSDIEKRFFAQFLFIDLDLRRLAEWAKVNGALSSLRIEGGHCAREYHYSDSSLLNISRMLPVRNKEIIINVGICEEQHATGKRFYYFFDDGVFSIGHNIFGSENKKNVRICEKIARGVLKITSSFWTIRPPLSEE
ncbi:MAG: hypothetical protein G01um101433_190 [Parcubacteria group bacterium Gr01-1014_33]|nr:MAG: hypothetical protein G01um101433_190 [Parcubacteria group bacterium Gr01-1014_33]